MMSGGDAWTSEGRPLAHDREPLDVVLSRIILAVGMSVALGVVATAVIWSGSPPSPDPPLAWRPSHQFRAVGTTLAPTEREVKAAADAATSLARRQPPIGRSA
jgi:hypothetical protein